jgi:WD40 repeat protein
MRFHTLRYGQISAVLLTVLFVSAPRGRGEELHSIQLNGWIGGLAFTPDGKQLVAGVADNTAVLIDVATGETARVYKGHQDYVIGVAISPDGKLLATGSYDHTAAVWGLDGDNATPAEETAILRGHRGVVMSVAFTPDSAMLATGSFDGEIRLWKPSSGELIKVLKGHKSWVNSLVVMPDGKQIVSSSSDGTVAIWDVATGKPLQSLRATQAEVRSVAVSPDGKQIATGLRYGQVKMWSTANWRLQLELQKHREDVFAVAFLNNRVLATGDGGWNQPGAVKLWDCHTGEELTKLSHAGEILSLAASRDGKILAAGSGNGVLKLWRLDLSFDK